jgi:hypothetical protein
MRRSRPRLVLFAVVLSLCAAWFAGCTASATVTANGQTLTIIQHTEALSVAPGQIASVTASCSTGETLVSGGYLTGAASPYDSEGVLDTYPSDSSGAAPNAQGQAEDSWTVRATNAGTESVEYFVSANCAKGITLTQGVWYQPTTEAEGVGAEGSVTCPGGPSNVLTGGGFLSGASSGFTVYASDAYGPAWSVVGPFPGSVFAVCVKGVIGEPEVFSPDNPVPVTNIGNNVLHMDVPVACPEGEVLVGGGYDNFFDGLVGLPMGTDAMTLGTTTQWHVGFSNTVPANFGFGSTLMDINALCVLPKWNGKVDITFSNYHHLLRIPADVTVATDGTGELKAGPITARVSQAQSAPIQAQKTINPATGGVSYIVPANCGDPAPADAAATAALKTALPDKTPAGQVVFGAPTITLDRASLTCTPAAGTTRTAPFTYVQRTDGSASQGTYAPNDVTTYQRAQLEAAAKALGSQYALRDTLICPKGPTLASATATKATITCAAYGVAEWQWPADTLRSLAQSLAGKSKEAALQILNATPGIDAGSAVIDLPQGNTLPGNADDITIIIVRQQDTPPVFRAP